MENYMAAEFINYFFFFWVGVVGMAILPLSLIRIIMFK